MELPNNSINSSINKSYENKAVNQVNLIDLLAKPKYPIDIDTWLKLTSEKKDYIEFNEFTGEWGFSYKKKNTNSLSFVDVNGELWAINDKSVKLPKLTLTENIIDNKNLDGSIWAISDNSFFESEIEIETLEKEEE